jgi:bacterioferritin (cytochrome b1)
LHADQIAERIIELGGEPDFAPQDLAGRSHAEYVAGDSLTSQRATGQRIAALPAALRS